MAEVAKHILVRAFDEVEHFHGEDVRATLKEDGMLYIYEKDSPDGEHLGIFKRWEYVRRGA